ncbi:cilia- and flagella-associated protein HOATZ isoform X2 [Hemicordylus capensis]|uniref:cilia- and flagella-associated protein HOATZ isoform X2 n=1 Tax=Hemicordylus capensis TaxID=884348 RepID=UPI0023022267|nr:cilia- and flagella-associated protein HOATZ isoform X2 [Hemicordylus capensis]
MAAPPPPPPPPPSSQTAAAGSPWPAGALVFAGCREQDVALAKLFWNSATLQPPLESRLGGPQLLGEPSDSRRGSNAPRRSHFDTSQKSGPISAQSSLITSRERIQETIDQPEKSAVKGPYLEKAKRREEILALLRKQREERIMVRLERGHFSAA